MSEDVKVEDQYYELALFAGAGGGLLASRLLGWRTVCYVEWDKYCVEVLKARIRDGWLDDGPIWDDAFTFDGRPWAGLVDVLSAGFPCQPFSNAGKGLAEHDARNGWPAVKRIIGEVRPSCALLENVPGLLSKPYIRRIFGDLAELGYDAEWGTLSAAAVGAPHLRKRLWIVAHAARVAEQLQPLPRQESLQPSGDGISQYVANPNGRRRQDLYALQAGKQSKPGRNGATISDTECHDVEEQGDEQQSPRIEQGNWWEVEPELGRVADGVANRVDRLAAIGNGQVPAVARAAWQLLRERAGEQ